MRPQERKRDSPSPCRLYRDLALLVTESRLPDPETGKTQGPHCPTWIKTGQPPPEDLHQSCEHNSFLCHDAIEIDKRAKEFGGRGLPLSVDVLLKPISPHGDCVCMGIMLEQWLFQLVPSRSSEKRMLPPQFSLQAVWSHLHFSQLSAWLVKANGKLPMKVAYRTYLSGEDEGENKGSPCRTAGNEEFETHDFPPSSAGKSILTVKLKSLPRREHIPTVSCTCKDPDSSDLTEENSQNDANSGGGPFSMLINCEEISVGATSSGTDAQSPDSTRPSISSFTTTLRNVALRIRSNSTTTRGSSSPPQDEEEVRAESSESSLDSNPTPGSPPRLSAENPLFKPHHPSRSQLGLRLGRLKLDVTPAYPRHDSGKTAPDRPSIDKIESNPPLGVPEDGHRSSQTSSSIQESPSTSSQPVMFFFDSPDKEESTYSPFLHNASSSSQSHSTPISDLSSDFCHHRDGLRPSPRRKKSQKILFTSENDVYLCDGPTSPEPQIPTTSSRAGREMWPTHTAGSTEDEPDVTGTQRMPSGGIPRKTSFTEGLAPSRNSRHKIQASTSKRAPRSQRVGPGVGGKEGKSGSISGHISRFHSGFHSFTGLPLNSSPAPLKRNQFSFDYDSSLHSVTGIRHALYHDDSGSSDSESGTSLCKSAPASTNLLGNFEESALNGRIKPFGSLEGFSLDLAASGAFCPAHVTLPVATFFFNVSDDNAPSPYLGHCSLENTGKKGYHLPRKGTVQATLFNPQGTVVKMFVVRYDMADMPTSCQTFVRQRTFFMPSCASLKDAAQNRCWLRYLIHLRFATSRSGKLYLHTDLRMLFSRKSELESFSSEQTEDGLDGQIPDMGTYELRSFTEMPKNPKFSPKKLGSRAESLKTQVVVG